ncbi:putative acid phosphatase SPBC4.06 [Colletotrichum tanaceti]|uniref:Putative acid phosphatase SPBC4.06 n=1 Tax=Colletotrichum tanaceti TaxID=1306861 RepID=A0A4U6XBL3_9PEZI|nr:putative acid phosphatase SPBC4.06 [Colletotrichum tanaceti]TKW52452.1 putative acid phosphatase SPBC4.06 [Colletotrichum tanaceti]
MDWPFNLSAKGPETLFRGTGPKSIPINDEVDKPLLPDGRRPIYCVSTVKRLTRRHSDKGELTDRGRASTMELGRQLRRLYIDRLNFMPRTLDIVRNTSEPLFRCKTFFAACIHQRRQDDVVVAVADPRNETLLPPEDYDERFAALLGEFTRRAAMKWNSSLEMRFINSQIGRWIPGGGPVMVDSQPLKLHGVLDTVTAVAAAPRPQDFLPPEFLDPGLRAIMEKICAEEEFAGYVHSKEFRRLGVGNMLQEVIQRMSAAMHRTDQPHAGGKDERRMFLFACHDSTIAGILASLGAMKDPDWFWPPYTAYITMELFRYVGPREGGGLVAHDSANEAKDAAGSSWFVRLNYQGKPVVMPDCVENGSYLLGCEGVYTFEALRDLIDEFAPGEEG